VPETILSIHPAINLSMALQPFVWPWPLFNFLILYTVGRTSWMGDQPIARPLPAHRTAHTQNKCTQTSMPQMGFKSTIPVFEWVKTVHALDRVAAWPAEPILMTWRRILQNGYLYVQHKIDELTIFNMLSSFFSILGFSWKLQIRSVKIT
jgi:hypothetical protein